MKKNSFYQFYQKMIREALGQPQAVPGAAPAAPGTAPVAPSGPSGVGVQQPIPTVVDQKVQAIKKLIGELPPDSPYRPALEGGFNSVDTPGQQNQPKPVQAPAPSGRPVAPTPQAPVPAANQQQPMPMGR